MLGKHLGVDFSTLNQLKRRGWNILNRFYLWKKDEETTNHLLLFCDKARMLWNLVYSLFGVQWVMHSSIRRNLLGCCGTWFTPFLVCSGLCIPQLEGIC